MVLGTSSIEVPRRCLQLGVSVMVLFAFCLLGIVLHWTLCSEALQPPLELLQQSAADHRYYAAIEAVRMNALPEAAAASWRRWHVCLKRPDGLYEDQTRGCQSFSACVNRKTYSFWCRNGTVFDPSTGHCVSSWTMTSSKCRDDAQHGPHQDCEMDGVFPDVGRNCTAFYWCHKKRKLAFNCRMGQQFDWKLGKCLEDKMITCPLETCLVEGEAVDEAKQCRQFYTCNINDPNSLTKRTCFNRSVYDIQSHKCRDAQQTICGGASKTPKSFACESNLPIGYYPDGDGRHFTLCLTNVTKIFSCPSRLLFDSNRLVCAKQRRLQQQKPFLEQHNRELCSHKHDGVYPVAESQCRQFIVCRNGTTFKHGVCLQGKRLDVTTQTCEPESMTMCGPPTDSECQGRFDGVFANRTDNCKSYFICVDEQIVAAAECPPNHVFNEFSKVCEMSTTGTCLYGTNEDTPIEYDCRHRVGIYPIFSSSCTTYKICAIGNSFEFQCPPGTRFNVNYNKCTAGHVVCQAPIRLGTFKGLSDKSQVILDASSLCKKWHETTGYIGASFTCPREQTFDIYHMICRSKERIRCIANLAFSTKIIEDAAANFTCTSTLPEIVADTKNSQSFYVCDGDGAARRFMCPEGLIFHEDLQMCQIGNDIGESNGNKSICQFLGDGQYADVETRCKKYYTCQAGLMLLEHCPPGQSFDSRAKICAPSDIINCPELPSAPPPPIVCGPNDVYVLPDQGSSCKQFTACERGYAKRFTCPDQLLFNYVTQQCEDALTCRIPSPNKNVASTGLKSSSPKRAAFTRCAGKKRGFYADYATGCRSYTACLEGGLAVSFTCSPGQLFNELTWQCDDAGRVRCQSRPSVPIDCSLLSDGAYVDHDLDCHVFYRCRGGFKTSHYCKQGTLFDVESGSCAPEEHVRCGIVNY